MAGEVDLYRNVLSKLKHISEAWTPKSNLPDKVPALPDVTEEERRNDWYNTFKEHRGYLEELLRNYLNALRKGASCSDLMKKLWTLKKKYKISTKEDGTNAKKHEYNEYLDIIDEIGKRLSKEQTASKGASNTETNDPKDKTVSVDDTGSPMIEYESTNEEKTTKPLPDEQRRTSDSQEKEVEDLRSELQKVTASYEDSQKALTELNEKLKPLQEQEHEYKEAIKRYNEMITVPSNKVKAKLAVLQAELEKKDTELKQQKQAYEQVQKELAKKQKECEKHSKEVANRPQTAPSGRYMKAIQNRIEGLEREKTMYCEQNLILKNEKDSLMQRLSKIAGTKMKDNNPAIADLSDPNRPERLAEQYKEIYDNAWTDVLDKLDEVQREDESNNVKTILDVLMVIYTACKDEIDSRKKTLMESVGYDENVLQKQTCLGGKDVYDSNIKICKDLIKSSAVRIKDHVLEVIKDKTEVAEVIKLCGDSAIKFVTNSAVLCIHMSVQDPPVVLDFSFQRGDTFDKDRLKAFTKGGDVIDYMVWPPMYLHTEGPLLSTGIAQGKSTKSGAIESKKSDQQQTSDDPKEATAQTAVEKLTKSKIDKRDQQNDQEPESSNDKRNEQQGETPADIHRTNNEQPSEQDVVVTSKDKSDKNREKGNSNGNNDQYSKRKDMAKEKTEQDSNQRHGEHKTEKNTNQQKEQHKPEAIQQTNQKEESAKKRGKGPKESEDEKSGKGKDNNGSVDDDDSVMKSGDTTKTSDKHQYKKKKKKKE